MPAISLKIPKKGHLSGFCKKFTDNKIRMPITLFLSLNKISFDALMLN